ncbi:hypothetical protein [Vibrio maerlii]|uniref:hypothetical protein n=1 Tax=Vibrio maerlii TaxID=2231648 RepID=UPI000E3E7EB8|nr:hypothetical protein [Vibrio maerlii]
MAVKHELSGTSDELVEALEALNHLTMVCKQAHQDMAKVSAAVTKVAETLDKVAKVVKKTSELLPFVV